MDFAEHEVLLSTLSRVALRVSLNRSFLCLGTECHHLKSPRGAYSRGVDMKKFFQIFAITAIAAGAYFVTASKQEVVDGDQVSVEMNVEMMSVAEASSPGSTSCRM